MSSNSTEISPESNFKNKLKKIKLANNSYGYIDPTWKPSFHELEKGVNEAAESIEKTKANLLYSSQNNPALRLLLYETDSTNTKILRKWSELLFRLSIAQQIIQKCIQEQLHSFKQFICRRSSIAGDVHESGSASCFHVI